MPIRVMITGAGGFVCRELAHGLAQRGHDVFALDLRYDSAARGCRSADVSSPTPVMSA